MTIIRLAAASLLALSGTAYAADWWLVDSWTKPEVTFVNAASIRSEGGRISYEALRIGRDGQLVATRGEANCGASGIVDAAAGFACQDQREREATALMLGDMSPEVTAEILFEMQGSAVR